MMIQSDERDATKFCHPRQGRAATEAGDPGDLEKNKALQSDFKRLSKLKDFLDPRLRPNGLVEDDRLLLCNVPRCEVMVNEKNKPKWWNW